MNVQTKKHTVFYFVLLVASINCAYASGIVYPYYATTERANAIESGYIKIKNGLTVSEVVSIMGKPDEIHDLYEPKIKNAKIIGFTYWYIIQRIQPSGSQIEKRKNL